MAEQGSGLGGIAKRRSRRKKRAKSARATRAPAKAKETNVASRVKLWKPVEYRLLREGVMLEKSPKEMLKENALKEEHLWHFISTSDNVSRLQSVDQCSKYEAAFRIRGLNPGVYVYPTHEQLLQIYRGYKMTKCMAIQDDGVPYITDKRLRRHMREKETRSNQSRKALEKKQKPVRRKDAQSIAAEHARRNNAPIPVDNKVAFTTPTNTIRSIRKAGQWDQPFNWTNLPKQSKLQDLRKNIDIIMWSIGSAAPLTQEEREKRQRMELEAPSQWDAAGSSDNNNGADTPSIHSDPLIFDQLNVSAEGKISYNYWPDFTSEEGEEDDDYELIRELAVELDVRTEKRSRRGKVQRDMDKFVSDGARFIPQPKRKKRRVDSPINGETPEERNAEAEIDALFESSEDDGNAGENAGTDSRDRTILAALRGEAELAGVPQFWYTMRQQLGEELAMTTIKQTEEYARLMLTIPAAN